MRTRAAILGLAALAIGAFAPPASAGSTLDRVKARGSLNCGGVPRPGLATRDDKGAWSGLEVEICRAVALAVLGSGRFDFSAYESTKDFDRARTARDDLSFLTPDEIAGQNLGGTLRPGPPVLREQQVLMVAERSPYQRPSDLGGRAICFIIATASDTALEAWASARNIDFVPNAFQEPGEMVDAYNVQRCQAVVGEANELAAIRRDGGINHLRSRLLPEPIATVPIFAATPRETGTRWADMVARSLKAVPWAARDTP